MLLRRSCCAATELLLRRSCAPPAPSHSFCARVAQYIKRKTKQIKKQAVLNLLYTDPRKVFYCVLFFPPAGLLAVTYKIQRYVTMASSAVDRRRKRFGHNKSNMLVGLFHNLRLLKRMRKLLYTEQCVGWNDEDEKTGMALLLCCLP